MPRLRLPDRSEPSLSSEAAAMISAPIRGQRTTDAISEHFHLMDSSSPLLRVRHIELPRQLCAELSQCIGTLSRAPKSQFPHV